MNRTYSPVALVVENDLPVMKRIQRGFLKDTSLGILKASDLETAKRYLDDKDLKIDFLLADLGFDPHQMAPKYNLRTGLDLIGYAAICRPDNPSWVFSALADDEAYRRIAEDKGLKIVEWFQKIGSSVLPWATVERELLLKVLKRDADFRHRANVAGIDVRNAEPTEALAERIRTTIRLPRLTYLTELPKGCTVLKPIEAHVFEEDGLFVASAPKLGLIARAEGDNTSEALDALGNLIAFEAASLLSSNNPIAGYADYVKEQLAEFVFLPAS